MKVRHRLRACGGKEPSSSRFSMVSGGFGHGSLREYMGLELGPTQSLPRNLFVNHVTVFVSLIDLEFRQF